MSSRAGAKAANPERDAAAKRRVELERSKLERAERSAEGVRKRVEEVQAELGKWKAELKAASAPLPGLKAAATASAELHRTEQKAASQAHRAHEGLQRERRRLTDESRQAERVAQTIASLWQDLPMVAKQAEERLSMAQRCVRDLAIVRAQGSVECREATNTLQRILCVAKVNSLSRATKGTVRKQHRRAKAAGLAAGSVVAEDGGSVSDVTWAAREAAEKAGATKEEAFAVAGEAAGAAVAETTPSGGLDLLQWCAQHLVSKCHE